jgi:hypothetical protein
MSRHGEDPDEIKDIYHRKLGTQLASGIVVGALLPAIASSKDWGPRPWVDPIAIQPHFTLHYFTIVPIHSNASAWNRLPTLGQSILAAFKVDQVVTTSPWYTWLTCNLYHTDLNHLLSHGLIITSSILTLEWGLGWTLATVVGGAMATSVITVGVSLPTNQVGLPLQRATLAYQESKHLLRSIVDSMYHHQTISMDQGKLETVRQALLQSVVGLRTQLFGHVSYGTV